jgi:hypothetical protein
LFLEGLPDLGQIALHSCRRVEHDLSHLHSLFVMRNVFFDPNLKYIQARLENDELIAPVQSSSTYHSLAKVAITVSDSLINSRWHCFT